MQRKESIFMRWLSQGEVILAYKMANQIIKVIGCLHQDLQECIVVFQVRCVYAVLKKSKMVFCGDIGEGKLSIDFVLNFKLIMTKRLTLLSIFFKPLFIYQLFFFNLIGYISTQVIYFTFRYVNTFVLVYHSGLHYMQTVKRMSLFTTSSFPCICT